MVKFHELGSSVKGAAKSATANGSYQNGAVGKVASGAFGLPTAGDTVFGAILMDVEKGDGAGLANYTVASGADVRVFELEDGVELDVTPESFIYVSGSTYGNIVVGDSTLGSTAFGVDTATGKFKQLASAPTTTGHQYFETVAKIDFNGKGIRVARKTK